MAIIEQECLITNGDPTADTISGYEKRGYIHLATVNANKFHPYATDTDMISFFAKPIDKVKYDADMTQWREKSKEFEATAVQ